jgi:hypothetical protein
MWYSWNGMTQPEKTEAAVPFLGRSPRPKPPATRNSSSLRTLLNPRQASSTPELLPVSSVSGASIDFLWKTFLKNVHPLAKVFFEWEAKPFIQKAWSDASSLSPEENALVSVVSFISMMSLTENDCRARFQSQKVQLLDRLQKGAEDTLLLADYTTTTNMLTLQALTLYLVGFRVYAFHLTITNKLPARYARSSPPSRALLPTGHSKSHRRADGPTP